MLNSIGYKPYVSSQCFQARKKEEPPRTQTPFNWSTNPSVHRAIEEHEYNEAKLELLPDFVHTEKYHSYWIVGVSEKKALSPGKSQKLAKEWGKEIRAFGDASGLTDGDLTKRMKQDGVKGVNFWHVDTKEGLAKLSKTLQEHYAGQK